MRLAEAWLIAAAVAARFGLGAIRFAGSPERFQNREEAHNATAAWLFGHGELLGEIARVQYRDFCGGCSVVALLGAPLLAGSEALWRWKLLALALTAAAQVVGVLALRSVATPAAGWAWLALTTLPPVGALDLSLMLWGNHQESALPVLLALLAHGRGRPFAMGLALGFGFYFARTSAYAAVVLLPLAGLAGGRRGVRAMAGFALGAALLFVPAAGGDAGWYRFGEALVPTLEKLGDRAGTLLLPGPFAARAWLPARDAALLGWGWLGALAAAALGLLAARRARVLVALATAWVVAYTFTSFPIFLVNARAPVNNIRYHSPWFLVGTLVLAAGLGEAWSRGWRRSAGLVLALLVVGNGQALWPQLRAPHPAAASLPATDRAGFVTTVAARFTDPDVLVTAAEGAPADVLARLRGITAAHVGAPLPDPSALAGYGEAVVAPCAGASTVVAALLTVPVAQRPQVGRGMGLTLSFCPRTPQEEEALLAALGAAVECAPCSLGGRRVLDDCGGPPADDPGALASCVLDRLAGHDGPRQRELAFGVGRAWVDSLRPAAASVHFVEAFSATPRLADEVAAGVADVSGGSHQPALARERPGAPAAR